MDVVLFIDKFDYENFDIIRKILEEDFLLTRFKSFPSDKHNLFVFYSDVRNTVIYSRIIDSAEYSIEFRYNEIQKEVNYNPPMLIFISHYGENGHKIFTRLYHNNQSDPIDPLPYLQPTWTWQGRQVLPQILDENNHIWISNIEGERIKEFLRGFKNCTKEFRAKMESLASRLS